MSYDAKRRVGKKNSCSIVHSRLSIMFDVVTTLRYGDAVEIDSSGREGYIMICDVGG